MTLLALSKTFRESERFSVKIVKFLTRQQSGGVGGVGGPHQPRKEQDEPKSWIFSVAGLKKHYELTPLVGCCALVFTMIGYMTYRGFTKNDVLIDRSKELPPWERVDLDKKDINKIFVAQQKFRGLPELKKLKKEINAEDSGAKKGKNNK